MLSYNLEELKKLHKERLDELIESAGTPKHLSLMLNVPIGTVLSWSTRGRISKEGAGLVELHITLGTKFKKNYLRPEL